MQIPHNNFQRLFFFTYIPFLCLPYTTRSCSFDLRRTRCTCALTASPILSSYDGSWITSRIAVIQEPWRKHRRRSLDRWRVSTARMWWAFYSNRQRAFRVSYGAKLIRRGDEDSSAQWRGAVIGQWVIESWSISSTLQVRFQKSNAPTKLFSTSCNFLSSS